MTMPANPYVMGREPLPHVEIHPQDAHSLDITNGDLIELFNPMDRSRQWPW